MEVLTSLYNLHWRPPSPPILQPLPSHITRTYIPTPTGSLELLTSTPPTPNPKHPAIVFAHGGYGHAAVWLEWMTYLHETGYGGTLYAYSARNHGGSYTVGYVRMVYGTGFGDVVSDFAAAVEEVGRREEGGVVVVGHSSGGGVAQFAVAEGIMAKTGVEVRGLCLVDAIPHYGALSVYANWAKHDPWFLLRNLFHLQHPSSPLSSPRLVHGAFFSRQFPGSAVEEFMEWMPRYESMGWPMGMMGSLWAWMNRRPQWLDVKQILAGISASGHDRVCVMVGSGDVLMDLGMARKQVAEYRAALGGAGNGTSPAEIEGTTVESAGGALLVVVDGAGHHLQNDLQRDAGAAALLEFVRQC